MTNNSKEEPQYFLTAPAPCPYLSGRSERKVFTYVTGQFAKEKNSVLTQNGFRRSQNIAYRPVCDGCRACISIRIIVDDFVPDRSMKRIIRKNAETDIKVCPPQATIEQYRLFKHYLEKRHADGGMNGMTFHDYQMMVDDTFVNTSLVEYRRALSDGSEQGKILPLIASSLTDVVEDGLSMVYSFFSPEEKHLSLGTFMILDHIRRAKFLGLPYVYLGYWIKGSKKMDYKSRFWPQEQLTSSGWKMTTD